MPRGARPGERRGGRARGTPNKLSGSVREMILAALEDVGGAQYLAAQAIENPAAFMTLLGKILPLQLAGDPNGAPISYVIRAPSPVESVAEWLRLHAPSDCREVIESEAEPVPPDAPPSTATDQPDA